MTGPEAKGTLRRDWRYKILGAIADNNGDFSPTQWHVLNEMVAGMIVEAQREARWEALEEQATFLETAHANSSNKGYSYDVRKGFRMAAGWVRRHAGN